MADSTHTQHSIDGQEQGFVRRRSTPLNPRFPLSDEDIELGQNLVLDHHVKRLAPDHCQDLSDCWIWSWQKIARLDKYALVQFQGRTCKAHRMSYAVFYGEIPEGMLVMHRCDTKPCVNPYHLHAGTHPENMHDMVLKGRSNHGEQSGMAKLTESEVLGILADTRKQRIIAEHYGIGISTVANIKAGRRWAHLQI